MSEVKHNELKKLVQVNMLESARNRILNRVIWVQNFHCPTKYHGFQIKVVYITGWAVFLNNHVYLYKTLIYVTSYL